MEDKSFATELLHELKASAKRWFIIAVVELIIIALLAGSLIWYMTLPVEEYSEVYTQNSDNDSFNQLVKGDIYHGGSTNNEDNIQEKGE